MLTAADNTKGIKIQLQASGASVSPGRPTNVQNPSGLIQDRFIAYHATCLLGYAPRYHSGCPQNQTVKTINENRWKDA